MPLILISGLIFSACGRVDPPEVTDDENTILLTEEAKTPEETENDVISETEEESTEDAEDTRSLTLIECEEEKDTLSEALEVNTEALRGCEGEKKTFSERLLTLTETNTQDGRYKRFLEFYLENNTPNEYPFPKCGAVASFTSESWYSAFETALTNAAIPFGRSTVSSKDLTGGCASSEGRIAFFLGAENEVLSEFHLIRYNLDTDTLEEALLVDGSCETCPNQLGKRFGPVLVLSGQDGASTVEYEYYYDDNILKQKENAL